MDSFDQQIENTLWEEHREKSKRVRSHKFNPSSFGRCYRYQVWNRANLPKSNPPDLAGLKRMKQGQETHKMIQACFDRTEIKIETEDVLGYMDIDFDNTAIDIKCTEAFKWKKYWNVPTHVTIKNKFNSWLQVLWYAVETKKPKAGLFGTVFGTFTYTPHIVEVSPYFISEVEKEINALREWWRIFTTTNTIPYAEPRAFGGNECNYCDQKTRCKEYENGTEVSRTT